MHAEGEVLWDLTCHVNIKIKRFFFGEKKKNGKRVYTFLVEQTEDNNDTTVLLN